MKRLSTFIVALTMAAALLLSSCGTDTGTTTVAAGAAMPSSSVTGAVAELSYADLAIDEANLSFDTADAVDVGLADGASKGGSGVSVDGDTVTIAAAGTYRVSGTLSSGSLVVDATDGVVNLVLDGADITAASVAAINVVDADQVVVWLADGSDNTLADATGSVVAETVEDSPSATLFSTSDLWIAGEGALSVTAHAADAITSKDTLVLAGGDVTVDAADDGVRGKDHLVITGGTLTANVQGDALRSDNESVTDEPDAAVGVIWIDGGRLDLTAGSDAVDAARQVTVLSGDLTIAASDDGLHSDDVLRIAGGTVNITESVEGIEGAYMYLSGGDVSVVAADDGINVSGGVEALTATTDMATTGGAEPGEAAGPKGQSHHDRACRGPRLAHGVRDGWQRLRRPRRGGQRHQVPRVQRRYVRDRRHHGRRSGRQRSHDHDGWHPGGLWHGRRSQRCHRRGRRLHRLRRYACRERHVLYGGGSGGGFHAGYSRDHVRRHGAGGHAHHHHRWRRRPDRVFHHPEGLAIVHLLVRCPCRGGRLRDLGGRRGLRDEPWLAGARRRDHGRGHHRHGRRCLGAIDAARTRCGPRRHATMLLGLSCLGPSE